MHYEQSRTTAGAGGVPLSQDAEQRATYEELVFLVDVANLWHCHQDGPGVGDLVVFEALDTFKRVAIDSTVMQALTLGEASLGAVTVAGLPGSRLHSRPGWRCSDPACAPPHAGRPLTPPSRFLSTHRSDRGSGPTDFPADLKESELWLHFSSFSICSLSHLVLRPVLRAHNFKKPFHFSRSEFYRFWPKATLKFPE